MRPTRWAGPFDGSRFANRVVGDLLPALRKYGTCSLTERQQLGARRAHYAALPGKVQDRGAQRREAADAEAFAEIIEGLSTLLGPDHRPWLVDIDGRWIATSMRHEWNVEAGGTTTGITAGFGVDGGGQRRQNAENLFRNSAVPKGQSRSPASKGPLWPPAAIRFKALPPAVRQPPNERGRGVR